MILGVDPGATGALAFYDTDLGTLSLVDMPTTSIKVRGSVKTRVDPVLLGAELRFSKPAVAAVEKVAARPGQGVSSMFAFGKATGIILGALGALGVPVHEWRPQEWQPVARIKGGAQIKDNARRRAAELFPAYAHLFARKKDSGRADAALMAYAEAVRRGLQ